MLEEYKISQPQTHKILTSSIANSKLSHAYIFESKNSDLFEFALAFAKNIICPEQFNVCENKDCHICSRIDSGNYPELIIIEPDGQLIKKEQVIGLQKDFSKKAIEGEKRIYIIKESDKFHPSAANSMLKFLEEPEENIIAILLTDNVSKVFKTIVSRCQIIKVKENEANYYEKIMSTGDEKELESFEELVKETFSFFEEYEKNGYKVRASETNILKQLKTKEQMEMFFEILLLIYSSVLEYSSNQRTSYFENYENIIKKVSNENAFADIAKKIDVILDIKQKTNSNLNSGLLIDKFLFRMDGVVNV